MHTTLGTNSFEPGYNTDYQALHSTTLCPQRWSSRLARVGFLRAASYYDTSTVPIQLS
jgi:hypothetical protein